jgi:ABC-type multidrug transport system ATPase subunit
LEGRIYEIDDLEGRISDVLADVELTSFAHEPVRIFSRGMMQRFMIAKAIIHDAAILLLDEPFSGLDVAAKQIALKLIEKERVRGKGVLLTTHDTELGYLAGSRFLFLLDGRIETVAAKGEIGLEALSRQYGSKLTK